MNFRDEYYEVLNMLKNEFFTVSFFDEEHRRDLAISDCDKFALTSLTAAIIFNEAKLTFLCRKIYWEQFNPEHLASEILRDIYASQPTHCEFIGEIIEVIDKR